MLIGLDCVPPRFAFERYREHMPNLSKLMERGCYGELRSTFPPITVPAWTCMVSGRDPGELGVYGFRGRKPGAYALHTHDASAISVPRVWDVLAEQDKRSAVLFVPPSYPPLKVLGESVSCFLTPDAEANHTFPGRLAGELEARFGPYVPDLENLRSADLHDLYGELERMTEQHFAIACHVWQTRHPDFLMMVEIGPDRFHHVFWEHLDPQHPRHVPGNAFEALGPRYYALLDRELGKLCALADSETAILVASDHGARALQGGFCINGWLQERGYLVLKPEPLAAPTPLKPEHVDWSRTRAWAEGGYYARLFLNVKGREPHGILSTDAYAKERDALRSALRSVTGPRGEPWHNRVHTPEELYREVRGDAPDLLAVFDDLNVRALSTVGSSVMYPAGDDRGADGCNHDWNGIFVAAGAGVAQQGKLSQCEIYDVGASVLGLFGIPRPAGWLGRDRSQAS